MLARSELIVVAEFLHAGMNVLQQLETFVASADSAESERDVHVGVRDSDFVTLVPEQLPGRPVDGQGLGLATAVVEGVAEREERLGRGGAAGGDLVVDRDSRSVTGIVRTTRIDGNTCPLTCQKCSGRKVVEVLACSGEPVDRVLPSTVVDEL